MSQVLPWVAEQRRVPAFTILHITVKILIGIYFAIVSVLWHKRSGLEQAVDITPIHTVLSQVVVPVVADRDVLTDGDGIEILSLQEHMIAVQTDRVALVVRSLTCTHNTFVASIGIRHVKLRHVGTTGQGDRMVVLQGVLVFELTPPVSA